MVTSLSKLFALFFAVIVFISCAPYHDPPSDDSRFAFKANDPRISFEWLQANVFESSCTSCHSGVNPDGNITLESYENFMAQSKIGKLIMPGDLGKSVVWNSISTGRMPKNRSLPPIEVALIKAWILAGAPEKPKSGEPPPPPPLPDPNFNSLWEKVFAPKCMSCHSGDEPDGDLRLETYDDFVTRHPKHGWIVLPGNSDFSAVWKSVKSGDMPKKAKPLSCEVLKVIKTWIDSGAPEKSSLETSPDAEPIEVEGCE